jgi:hypothetical protein
MDTDRLDPASYGLSRRVQGLTTGHWAIVAVLALLAVIGGWAWTSLPADDSDPWITLSVSGPADGSDSERSVARDPRAIARALDAAGLDGYRFEGDSLRVRASQVERTLATLERTAAPEDTWTARWEDQLSRLGAFSTAAQHEQAREIALRKDIRQLLTAVPEIAEVQVLLARSRARHSFGSQRHRVTATIGIKPRPGIQLTDDQIETLRQVVAGGVPDLVSDDVVIFDQSALTDSALPVSSRTAPDEKTVQRGQQPDVSSVDPVSSEPQEISIPAWLMPLLIGSSLVGLVLIVASLRRRADVPSRLPAEELIPAWVDDMSQRMELDEEGFETGPGEDLSESIATETEHSAVDKLAGDESSDPLPDAIETSGDVVGEAAEVVAADAGGRLAFLTNAQPSLLAGWLTDEHPQVAAVIVSELPEGFGVEVLSCLSAELRADLESRLSGGVEVHEDVLVDLAETLKDRWRDAESRLLHDTLTRHETQSTAATHGWSNSELALLQAVEGILARFDDLIGVESSIIRAVYDLVGPHPFRQALSGSDIEIRRAVLNRLTPLARMELARQIDQQDPVRLADIKRSQHEILKHTRRLLAAADPSWLAEGPD